MNSFFFFFHLLWHSFCNFVPVNYRISGKKHNYLLYFIAIGLSMMIGSKMEEHENRRDKEG